MITQLPTTENFIYDDKLFNLKLCLIKFHNWLLGHTVCLLDLEPIRHCKDYSITLLMLVLLFRQELPWRGEGQEVHPDQGRLQACLVAAQEFHQAAQEALVLPVYSRLLMSLSYLLPSYVYMTTNIWSYFRISRMAKMFCGVLTALYHSHYRNSFAGISLLQIQNMAGIFLMRKDRDNWCLLTILSILKNILLVT